MLKKIYIDNFRHFRDFTFEPNEQVTLLSGLNGTGKTTIVEVVNRLQQFLVAGASADSIWPFRDKPKWKSGHSEPAIFGLDFKIDQQEFLYRLKVASFGLLTGMGVQEESLLVNGEAIYISKDGNAETQMPHASLASVMLGIGLFTPTSEKKSSYPVDTSLTGLKVASRQHTFIRTFLNAVETRIYAISLNPYLISGIHQEPGNVLQPDGSNFSAWFDTLTDKHMGSIGNYFSEIKAFIPGFEQFIFDRQTTTIRLHHKIYQV